MPDFSMVCEKAVRLGAEALMERFGKVEARHKGHADLVTEADYASQEVIRRTVLDAFPDHGFLGEETLPDAPDEPEAAPSQDGYRWIVDPLDGTTNYVHQVPFFSVSLALERAGDLLVGCVFNPVSGECFSAAKGRGAWLDGQPLRTSNVEDLGNALTSTGFPYQVTPEAPDVKLFLAGLQQCQALRRTGSAALNMSYLAAGRFDAAWSFCTQVWDIAAGALLIREAGGAITSPDGGELQVETGRFLAAANDRLLEQLIEMAAQAGI